MSARLLGFRLGGSIGRRRKFFSRRPHPRWWVLGLLVAAMLLVGGCRHPGGGPAVPSFDFVQMCDPQLGFGDYAADLARFNQAVRQVNQLRPDLVVICGDLVNVANENSYADLNAARKRFEMPSYAAPGNHDVGNEPTAATLERYRRLIGKDYFSVEHKGRTFVILNSQLWKAPVPAETEAQDRWLEHTLRAAAKRHRPVFIVMHYPLFLEHADEPDNYYNLPLARRKPLLDLFERSGVVAVLIGHTHTTFTREYRGIQMVSSENTSRSFDGRPPGFRLWHVGATHPYAHEFVPLVGEAATNRCLTSQNPDGELPGWKSFHEAAGATTGEVWRLQSDGVLVCRGVPRGYLYTEENYANFILQFEWRYPAGATNSNGGALVRTTGEHAIWPKCLEFQLNQGQAGDFWAIRSYEVGGPAGRVEVMTNTAFGTLRHLKRLGAEEKPAGEWNQFEGIVQGGRATQKINGVVVNEATGCDPAPGRIAFTAEGQEIQFRSVRIVPLP